MKNIWIWTLAISMLGCQTVPDANKYVISVDIQGLDDGYAYLQDRIAGLMVNVDTARIEDGKFTFTGQIENPELYYLSIDGIRARLNLFLENSKIDITIDAENPSEYTVSGSKSHDIFSGINKITSEYDETLRGLQQQISSAEEQDDMAMANELREHYVLTEGLRRQAVRAYIAEYPSQPAAVYIAIRQLAHGLDASELADILSIFNESLEGTRYYDDLQERITILERVAIGKDAIDFTLPDSEGKEVSLSDFRGQYVLINFWASWCPYCRVENPHLVNIYESYQSEDFEIIGVSLDREKEVWLKGIEEDGLLWPQVSDLQGWNSGPAASYAVRSIPQNVLVDQNGIIIGRNLDSYELEEKLSRLLAGF